MNLKFKTLFKDINSYSVKRDVFFYVLLSIAAINLFMIALYIFVFDITTFLLIFNFAMFFAVNILTMILLKKTHSIRRLSAGYIAYFSFIFLPVFTSLGLEGGSSTPFWFMASIVVMFLILDLRDFWWVFLIALYIDTFFYVKNYIWNTVSPVISDTNEFFIGYILSFLAVGGSLFVVIIYNEKNYKKIRNEIDKSREVERNAGASKSRFLSNMSNEIRTPMNSIISLSELVLKEEMSEDTRNEINVIKQSSYELLEIIDDVLMYAQLDSNNIKMFNVDFRFDELVKQVLESVSANIDRKDLKVRVRINPNIPKILNGDDIRIRQIITRLIYISLSLTDNGRIMLSIDCKLSKDGTKARFTVNVADTGCGLSDVDIDAIMGAYEIYDSRQNSNLKGVSLKFNICEELLEIMGGSLTVRSIEGVGLESIAEFECFVVNSDPIVEIKEVESKHILIYTNDNRELNSWKSIMEGVRVRPDYVNSYYTFEKAIKNSDYNYIFVPSEVYPSLSNIIQAFNCEDYTYVIGYSKNSFGDFDKCRLVYHPISCLTINTVLNDLWKAEDYIAKTEDVKYDGSAAKILVVDDNGVNLKVAAGVFKSFNIDIDTAKSGMEALDKCKEKEYHLVLMDMVMPEMSGTETLRKMRNSSESNMKDVPVVALTANSGGNIREEILDEGFQEYIAKPIKVRYLLQVLVQFLPKGALKKVTNSSLNNEKKKTASTNSKNAVAQEKADNNILVPERGLQCLGNNAEAYNTVLNTYYKEGVKKIQEIPKMFDDKDIALFTTTVHGIKSSSASIGASVLSEMFKKLEEFGKTSDIKNIEINLNTSLEAYRKILEDVKKYLIEKGKFTVDVKDDLLAGSGENKEADTDLLSKDSVLNLEECINSMDFAETDKVFGKLLKKDFGEGINIKLLSLKEAVDSFDFTLARNLILELQADAS